MRSSGKRPGPARAEPEVTTNVKGRVAGMVEGVKGGAGVISWLRDCSEQHQTRLQGGRGKM